MHTTDFSMMANEDIVRTITGTQCDVKGYFLRELYNMSETELTQIKGIGEKTAKRILAAFELGKRLIQEKTYRNDIGSSLAIYNRMLPILSNLEHEECWVIIMNQHFKELDTVRISVGSTTETCMDIREILRQALIRRGTIIAIAHNHPSGSPTPSKADDNITFQIEKACNTMRILFMDHVIIGDGCFYSYHDKGKL